MAELIAGSPERERWLRAKMIEALLRPRAPNLIQCTREQAEAFADAFVRASRPARAKAQGELFPSA